MTNDFVNRKGQLDDLKEMQKLFVDTITAICKTDYDSDQILAWISGVHNCKSSAKSGHFYLKT